MQGMTDGKLGCSPKAASWEGKASQHARPNPQHGLPHGLVLHPRTSCTTTTCNNHHNHRNLLQRVDGTGLRLILPFSGVQEVTKGCFLSTSVRDLVGLLPANGAGCALKQTATPVGSVASAPAAEPLLAVGIVATPQPSPKAHGELSTCMTGTLPRRQGPTGFTIGPVIVLASERPCVGCIQPPCTTETKRPQSYHKSFFRFDNQ